MKDIKQILISLLLVLAGGMSQPAVASETMEDAQKVTAKCEADRVRLGYPYHYCKCHEEAVWFFYGIEAEITDTVWFWAEIDDLRQGISAYWFADCSVTMELYAYCTSKEPTISMTVGGNQMREKDMTEINRKLDEMGDMAQILQNAVTPRLKVYPNKNSSGVGSGYVYVYPYDEGPNSTCDDPLPVRAGMTYISSSEQDIYRLAPAQIPTSGKMCVQWKQKTNQPCTLNVRQGDCDGPIILTKQFADSTKLLYLDENAMKQHKSAKDTLYFEFNHASDITGRIMFRNNVKMLTDTIDSTFCQGKYVELLDTILRETTEYPDTVWVTKDTVRIHQYNLHVTLPDTIHDTLRVTSKQLPLLYKNQERINKGGYGNYEFLIHEKNGCDTYYFLNVEHKITYTSTIINQTLCKGKSYNYNGTVYTSNYDLQDSVWIDEDTRAWADIHIHFTEPTMEFDTVWVYPSVMNSATGYYYRPGNTYFHTFGTDTITVTKKNTCTRVISVTRMEEEEPVIPCDPTDPTSDCYECDPTDPTSECYVCDSTDVDSPCYVCDPTDPTSECYVCDTTDINGPCYKRPCDPNDPLSDCYCDPTNPLSDCYVCDSTDVNGPCYKEPCDPTDPTSECYVCDSTDINGPCYKEPCDPTDLESDCYVCDSTDINGPCYKEPCDPTDPESDCYVCDSTDVNGPCYKEPCDPTDPEGDCYEPCDPTDPESDCYEPCDPEDPESDCYKEALDDVNAEKRVVRKVQEGGMLYIEVNGERFTLLGTKVEQ